MKLLLGDCLEQMKTLEANSVDAVVTDPPYGLAFMNKKWDYDVPSVDIWREVYRVLKPGGHVLSFGGTRTYHRMVVNIEDAGFEIRDQVQWNFGSGFPKSHNVYKAALKAGLCCACDVQNESENSNSVRGLPQDSNEMEMLGETDQDADVQLSVQRNTSRSGLGEARLQGSFSPDAGEFCEGSNARSEKSSMEGWYNLQAQQGQLHRSEVCEMSEGIFGDESQRRLRNGASIGDGENSQETTRASGSGSPQRSQHKEQRPEKSGAMALQSQSQIGRAVLPECPKCKKQIIDPGWGSALKPANEPICLARKPLEKGLTLAENVLKWGTGAINVDGCRIETQDDLNGGTYSKGATQQRASQVPGNGINREFVQPQGRWPANVLFDEDAAEMLDEQSGVSKSTGGTKPIKQKQGVCEMNASKKGANPVFNFGDFGGASRFFYVAKASKRERNAGLEGMPEKESGIKNDSGRGFSESDPYKKVTNQNFHPTVKPIKLMEYLCKLITPPNGTILDPFMGSGSTGVAAKNLGFNFIGCEMSAEYFEIAQKRIEHTKEQLELT